MLSVVATRRVLQKNHDKVSAIVLANQFRGDSFWQQLKVIRKLIKKSSIDFFLYKVIESKLYNGLLAVHRKFSTKKYQESPSIEDLAKKHHIPIIHANDLSNVDFLNKINDMKPDLVLCFVSQILKKSVFEILGNKVINVHGSYLPEYRGPAQYYWYLHNEDPTFGVTVHYMTTGLDTGDIILQKRYEYDSNISAYKLHYIMSDKLGDLFNEFLSEFEISNEIQSQAQEENNATFTSFPCKADIKLFKSKGKKLFTMKDFLHSL